MVNCTYFDPYARPLYVMAKPAGPMCNLACDYCYYLEKSSLIPATVPCGSLPSKASQVPCDSPQGHSSLFILHSSLMSDAMLERFVSQYIASQSQQEVLFTWHGGEPLMRDLAFYRRAVELQHRYANGHVIDNCIQTNGTLLTDEHCRFFHDNGWLVGISIDGPQELHDACRKNRAGAPTFHKVMRGIELLQKHNVEWNAMAVVNAINAEHPQEFYRFFKDIDCKYIQFAPIVERTVLHDDGRTLAHIMDPIDAQLTPLSVTPEQWGNFLCKLFDEWVKEDVGEVFVQLFEATLANWCGVTPGVCTLGKACGHVAVMEYNGDVYSCDHFVFPEYRLGNLSEHTFLEMMYGEQQSRFAQLKQQLPGQCRRCQYLFACNGECPKNRFLVTPDGEYGLNYLCEGYRRYFEHVTPFMEEMKKQLA
ncbi:MAG: anaerobic sulfatase-maturation protein [Prevotella sp.]|nr:anaerobic sulfatase-maturation protein [Prevotella sp.]